MYCKCCFVVYVCMRVLSWVWMITSVSHQVLCIGGAGVKRLKCHLQKRYYYYYYCYSSSSTTSTATSTSTSCTTAVLVPKVLSPTPEGDGRHFPRRIARFNLQHNWILHSQQRRGKKRQMLKRNTVFFYKKEAAACLTTLNTRTIPSCIQTFVL